MAQKRNMFPEDIELPEIVMQKANGAFAEIRMEGTDEMKKNNVRMFRVRKAAVAAAVCGLIAIGGASVYAATSHFSLLSLFRGETEQTRHSAEQLFDDKVEQERIVDKKQTKWANFKVREAICDNNHVIVNVAATAVEPEKYVLIPSFMEEKFDSMSSIGVKGEDGKLSMSDYADKRGKKILKVNAGVSQCKAGSQSIRNVLEPDGTLLFIIEFDNKEKNKTLDYSCITVVTPPIENVTDDDLIRDKFNFTLVERSKSEKIRYVPLSKDKVEGTDLIIDDVSFNKSDLTTECTIKYHYAGEKSAWKEYKTKDLDIMFFMLDDHGKIVETDEGGGIELDGMKVTGTSYYKLSDLPENITFMAKDVCEKKIYGKFTVKRVD